MPRNLAIGFVLCPCQLDERANRQAQRNYTISITTQLARLSASISFILCTTYFNL